MCGAHGLNCILHDNGDNYGTSRRLRRQVGATMVGHTHRVVGGGGGILGTRGENFSKDEISESEGRGLVSGRTSVTRSQRAAKDVFFQKRSKTPQLRTLSRL